MLPVYVGDQSFKPLKQQSRPVNAPLSALFDSVNRVLHVTSIYLPEALH
jgi:hypothetical protein